MSRIACRWPGGMTLAFVRPDGIPPATVRLAGPDGVDPVLQTPSAIAPPREAADTIRQRVQAMAKTMADTAGDIFGPLDYGVTDVPGDFWMAWLAVNQDFDVIRHNIVFEL